VKLASLKFLKLSRGRQSSVRFTDDTEGQEGQVRSNSGSGGLNVSVSVEDSRRGTLTSRRSNAHLGPARTDLLAFGQNFRSMMMKSNHQSYMMTGFVDVETGDEITATTQMFLNPKRYRKIMADGTLATPSRDLESGRYIYVYLYVCMYVYIHVCSYLSIYILRSMDVSF
jgi:hypothetical protein